MEIKPSVRIKDIAKLAGVSVGTVDRVLHKRGEVSAKSLEAVTKVLEEIDYSPNLIARSLASKKLYYFDCLIPMYSSGEYWEIVNKGFELASQHFRNNNILIRKHLYDQFDESSFVTAYNEVLEMDSNAVFISPIFKAETLNFTLELTKRNILFSFIDSKIDGVDYLAYYGQDSFKSGYIAAKLLLLGLPDKADILVIRYHHKGGSESNQTISRYMGFMKYIEDFGLENKIQLIEIQFDNQNDNQNIEKLNQALTKYPTASAAIVFNSRVYKLAMYLGRLKHTGVRVVGYDLLTENINYLKQDSISYLIAQRPEKQAFLSVKDMCNKLIFKQEISPINFMPIDIIIKENIDDYLMFQE